MAITDIFSFGNLKLPRTTAIFNLPRLLTCPGATPLCKLKCYSMKAERRFRVTRIHRHDMFMLSKTSAFPWILETALERLPAAVTHVRIHESGDFYLQHYLDLWIAVAKKFPREKFYAYTKSWELDFSGRPANMIVRLSLDSSSLPEAVQVQELFDGVAWMQLEGEAVPEYLEGAFVCPGDCELCSYCGDEKGPVIFPEH